MVNKKIIITDEPLKSPDQDRLDFAPFTERVANVVKNMEVKESVVFAVYGKWGSGKTTFLNFFTFYLNDSDPITIVKFNPWWFSGNEDLIQQFLHNLKLKLMLNSSGKLKEIARLLEPYIEAFGEIPKLGWIVKAINRFKKTSQKSVAEIKEEIITKLEKIDGKIVVIIDDIDRLTAAEIRDLFTIVKAIANFPNTVYILAFDKEVAIRALEKVQEGKGEDYLEKIIQVSVELPLVNKTSIRKMLDEELSAILYGTPNELFDSTYWENVYWEGINLFINTFRDLKRLINTIRITYPSVKGEVNAVDFIAIETIRVFCPKVYNIIKNNPDMFCGHKDSGNYSISSQSTQYLEKFHQNWISDLSLPDNIKESIKELLMRLFPKLESVFGNNHYGPDWEQEWRKKCKICSKEIFPRFFSFSVPTDDLSRYEMESILRSINNNNKDDFSKFLKYLITQIRSDDSTKLSIFLERMEDYISEIQQDNISTVIETFYTIGDELIIPEDEFGDTLISLGNNAKMGRIMWKLLRKYADKNKRFEILKNAFENGWAISMMADELISLWQQYENHSVGEKYEENMIVENGHLKILQEIVLDKIREAAKDNLLLTTPLLPQVLCCWNKWGIKNEVREWVSAMINSDEKLPIFLSKFLQKNTSWTITDKVCRVYWRLNPNSLKEYMDIDTLEKRCNYILSNDSIANNLDDRQKLALRQFLKEKQLLNNGKNSDDPFL